LSGRKNFLGKKAIVTAGDMSQATVTSSILNIQGLDNIGIQVNILSGTATGTFDVQVSADHTELNGTVVTAGTFTPLGSTYQVAITSGSPSTVCFNLNQLAFPYVNLKWTKTSGTGSFEAFATGKAI
jgi:hypothetical protein